MDKALMKVTRFNNSDVIATSGYTPCHESHLYVSDYTGTNGYLVTGTIYNYNPIFESWDTIPLNETGYGKEYFPDGIASGTYYGMNAGGFAPDSWTPPAE